jgi:NADH pyrophosphatase NudC (nudix superfamily)
MGSMPRLPKKIEYRYRKGSTDESQNCKHCVNITIWTALTPFMKCPKCGKEMHGAAPHGPWKLQYECRHCGAIVTK